MLRLPVHIVFTTQACGQVPLLSEYFREKAAACFPAAKLFEFCGPVQSFELWCVKQNIFEAARVVVQPLCVVVGEEYHRLLMLLAGEKYGAVQVSFPLLGRQDGAKRLALRLFEQQKSALSKGEAVLFVGHGSKLEAAENMYSEFAECLAAAHHNLFAVSLKADFGALLSRLHGQWSGVRRVRLVPLLVSAEGSTWRRATGNTNDSLRLRLEKAGFECTVCREGLLENPAAQDAWLENIRLILAKT